MPFVCDKQNTTCLWVVGKCSLTLPLEPIALYALACNQRHSAPVIIAHTHLTLTTM